MEARSRDGFPKPSPVPISSPRAHGNTSRRKIVKRSRPVLSCVECRNRKLRCDRLEPCAQCQRSNRVCRYAGEQNGNRNFHGSNRSHGTESDTEPVERPAKRPRHSNHPLGENHPRRPPPDTESQAQSHDRLTMATPGWDEVVSRLDRLEAMLTELRSPDRRPGSPQQRDGRPLPRVARRLSSIRTWLSLFDEANETIGPSSKADALFDLVADLAKVQRRFRDERRRAREPIAVFSVSIVPVQKRMADILPPKPLCDRLLQVYLTVADCLYRVIHVPSFKEEYAQYWDGGGCNDTFLPRLLCVLSVAAWFGTDSRGLGHDQTATIHIPTACVLVRQWVDEYRNRRVVDAGILQVELLILRAQSTIVDDQRTLWTQLGYVVRMALDMGLQHDPADIATLSELSKECRRRLWFTLAEMDLNVSLMCNRPCAIRPGDYSCKPPKNLDDEDLCADPKNVPESKPLEQATDNQVHAYCARTLPVRLEAAALLARLDTVINYDEILRIGVELEGALDNIDYIIPPSPAPAAEQPTAWRHRAVAVLDMSARLPLMALYRLFALSRNCPPSISLTFLKSCMTVLTHVGIFDNELPAWEDVAAVHHPSLKRAILDAAFSVCWYISQASQSSIPGLVWSSSASNGWDGVTPRYPWTGEEMVETVERVLERLIGLIREGIMSKYLREVVALSVLLEVVQTGTAAQKLARVEARLGRIWAVCSQWLPVMQTSSNGGGHQAAPSKMETTSGTVGDGAATWAVLIQRWERSSAPEGEEAGLNGANAAQRRTVAAGTKV